MQFRALGYLKDRWPFGHDLNVSPTLVERLVRASGAEPWHSYAIQSRRWRRHVCAACSWLAEALPRDALIFEPGCGSGANLLWLAQRGFRRLQGTDVQLEALQLCRDLAKEQGCGLDVWRDDAMRPVRPPQAVDAILSVNWLYHIPGASLEGFLRTYRPALRPGGIIVCDVVDKAYDAARGNRYHTSDSHLPEARRRPSEYVFRLSADEVERIAAACGFCVLRRARFLLSRPQRAVYMLQAVETAAAKAATNAGRGFAPTAGRALKGSLQA